MYFLGALSKHTISFFLFIDKPPKGNISPYPYDRFTHPNISKLLVKTLVKVRTIFKIKFHLIFIYIHINFYININPYLLLYLIYSLDILNTVKYGARYLVAYKTE